MVKARVETLPTNSAAERATALRLARLVAAPTAGAAPAAPSLSLRIGRSVATARRLPEGVGNAGPPGRKIHNLRVERAFAALTRLGKAGRVGAAPLDLLRSVGPAALAREVVRQQEQHRHGPDLARALFRRIWDEAAAAAGATVEALPGGYLLIRRGPSSTVVYRQMVRLDDAVTLRMAADKPLTHRLLAGLDCLLALRLAGLNLHTGVEAGGEVAVRTVSSHNRREDNATVTDRVDPDLVAVARAAAGAVGVRLAGVDCVVKDVSNWSA